MLITPTERHSSECLGLSSTICTFRHATVKKFQDYIRLKKQLQYSFCAGPNGITGFQKVQK